MILLNTSFVFFSVFESPPPYTSFIKEDVKDIKTALEMCLISLVLVSRVSYQLTLKTARQCHAF